MPGTRNNSSAVASTTPNCSSGTPRNTSATSTPAASSRAAASARYAIAATPMRRNSIQPSVHRLAAQFQEGIMRSAASKRVNSGR